MTKTGTKPSLSELNSWLDSGQGGVALTQQYSLRIDCMVRALFYNEPAEGKGRVRPAQIDGRTGGRSVGRRSGRSSRKYQGPHNLTLLATGGYGRMEMAPFSDVDLLFIAADRKETEAAEQILYRLWDSGLDISHAFRTPEECIEEAFADIRTRTSLLEARYLAGDPVLYDLFCSKVLPAVTSRRQRDFVREKLLEKGKRHHSAGNSVFLLEPNVKDGEGGLRDVHTAFWLSKVALKTRDYAGFFEGIPPLFRRRFLSAYDFLLRARFCLHLESNRKNDLLSFEFQRVLAPRLGFLDSKKFSGVERMLRYYYLKSRAIQEITADIVAQCSRPYVTVTKDFSIRKITEDFSVSGGSLIATAPKGAPLTAGKIMEAFSLMARTGKRFSPGLRRAIRTDLLRINRKARIQPRSVNSFLEILKGGRVYDTLREMHDSGVLGRFLPEFGALRMLVIHEPYHLYTVDEHTLVAIRNLELLRTTSYKSLEDLHHIINSTGQLDVLFLSLLLHDIGKAAGRNHEEEGYKRQKDILERFNLAADKRSRIGFLVRNHILMSETALKREAHDPEVIARFAEAVGDPENLNALYLITYADMSAVNPGFWSSWKAYLLKELYLHTLDYLNGVTRDRKEYVRDLLSTVRGIEPPLLAAFISEMPERYLLSAPREKIIDDYRLVNRALEGGFAVRIDKRADGLVEISVSTADSHGLFSKLVGFLSSKGLNIVNGRIFTCRNGLVIDKIAVSNWQDIWWDGLVLDLTEGLKAVIAENRPFHVVRRPETNVSPYDIFIELDNETSDEVSIIEVFSPDRLGLLYDISLVLAKQGVSISSARINTESGLAQDIFSVRSGNGKLGAAGSERLLSALWMTLRDGQE
ncbi:MAG: [protein-PII] uridylyltransferase [Thermodesulfovibrio sp.]|nr:[protein-PII] uridylyltransferase [Thermodesulfovibrio sp.]